jgi:hypothetical protein
VNVSYTPAQRRQNLIYAACHRYVRDRWPGVYARIRRSAEINVPREKAGRRGRPVEPPRPVVPVPVMEFKRPMKTLRPMRRKG